MKRMLSLGSRNLRLAATVGLILAVAAMASPALVAHPDAIAVPVAPGTMEACELHCWEGGCDGGEHDAFDSGLPEDWDAVRNGGAHNSPPLCKTGTCDTKHGPLPCDPYIGLPEGPFHILHGLRQAVLEQDAKLVAQAAVAAPERVLVNRARSAVQVTGCKGGIVAHLPVSAVLLRTVEQYMGTDH